MRRFLLVSLTGWIAVLLIGIEAALPYLIRNRALSSSVQVNTAGREAPVTNLHTRMWPHYWIGYSLGALILAHTWFVMGPAMARSDTLGIWSATVAFFLLPAQIGLGLLLKDAALNGRSRLWAQRLHFWIMVVFILLVVLHVTRNAS